jgi:hypothetical protein
MLSEFFVRMSAAMTYFPDDVDAVVDSLIVTANECRFAGAKRHLAASLFGSSEPFFGHRASFLAGTPYLSLWLLLRLDGLYRFESNDPLSHFENRLVLILRLRQSGRNGFF